jgi:hypothetical protein
MQKDDLNFNYVIMRMKQSGFVPLALDYFANYYRITTQIAFACYKLHF